MTEKINADLNYFLKCADKYHINFYHTHTKEELKNYIINYQNCNKVDNEYQLLYMLKNIIKYMSGNRDSHTTVNFNKTTYLPLDFIYIVDSLFINSTFDDNFNKSRVLKINNIPINQLINELEPIVSYTTNEWFERNIEIELKKVQTLSILPSINCDLNIIEILTDKGTLRIDMNKEYPKPMITKEKYNLVNGTLIVRYKSCEEKNKPNIEEIDEIINNNNVNCIAIDMRNNSGGNETILQQFINYLMNKNINIDVIVNKGVFSATRWNILDLVNIGANVIGEKIGTSLNCFGSRNHAGLTPNYNVNMVFSKWYILYDKKSNKLNVIKSKEELKQLDKKLLNNSYLVLNNEINLTKNEYLNNIDPIFNYYKDKR